MSDLEGVMLGDYLLLKRMSKRGVVDVYRACQRERGNLEVVVKVFRLEQHGSFRTYFLEEAAKVGQLDHPNILPLLEYGEAENLLYVVTPFVSTGTLADLLQRVGGRFSALQALPIVQQLCSGLQYAHEQNSIHGNIKPTNVLVGSDGRMLLADFACMRGYDDSQQSFTRIGWGAAEYMSPEQSLGVLRRASDIYSLGALIFTLLTGMPPFTGQTPVAVLLKHVRQPPPSARTLVPVISEAVDKVLCTALQKRSDDRYASAEALSQAFCMAVTVAPGTIPAAKILFKRSTQVLRSQTEPLEHTQIADNALNMPASVVNPPTPLPPLLASSPTSSFSSEPSSALPLTGQATAASVSSLQSRPFVGEEMKEIFSERKEASDMAQRWSANPEEWSPLVQLPFSTEHAPQAGTAYSHPRKPSLIPFEDGLVTALPPLEEHEHEWNRRLHRWLPYIVVCLLLLGLLAALCSAFLY